MEMTFKRYVSISERSVAAIADSIDESRQNCDNWLRREYPIFVEIDPEGFESIKRVFRVNELYTRPKIRKTRKTRQVKK